jgi:hypothetical protein
MTTTLQKKLRQVEEEHAEETLQNHLRTFSQQERDEAMRALGAIGAVNKISNVLSAEAMRFLMKCQENKIHEALGFERFDDFLNESPHSPMTKHQFYDRKKLLEAEGDTIYEAFNQFGIPFATRKLLAQSNAGEIAIEGDEILIGENRANLSDLPMIKELIKTLANDNREITLKKQADEKKIEDLERRIKTGQSEYEELRRAVDAQAEGTPYEQKLMKAIGAMVNLSIEANKLPLVEKERRGRGDVESLWKQMLLVRHALMQEDFALLDDKQIAAARIGDDDLAKKAFAVLSQDDDWGDEDE